MNSVYTDVLYALKQLRGVDQHNLRWKDCEIAADRVQRAIDVLERVEAELRAPLSQDEES